MEKIISNLPFIYNNAGRKNSAKGDCLTRSISIIAELPYEDVYETVKLFCSRRRSKWSNDDSPDIGVNKETTRRILKHFGFKYFPIMKIGQKCDSIFCKENYDKGILPNGKVILSMMQHVCAFIDGELHDVEDVNRDSEGNLYYVYGYWKLIN